MNTAELIVALAFIPYPFPPLKWPWRCLPSDLYHDNVFTARIAYIYAPPTASALFW